MKKFLLACLYFCLVQIAMAEDPNDYVLIDHIHYKIWLTRGTAEVCYLRSPAPEDLVLPDTLVHNGSSYPITQINGGFVGVQGYGAGIRSIHLPIGLKNIGPGAFSGCSQLQAVCLPQGLNQIGAEAFRGCSQLREIFIPQSVNYIGKDAFYNSGLQWVFNASVLDLVEMNKDYYDYNGPHIPYKANIVRADSLGVYQDFEYYVYGSDRYIYRMESREHLDLPLGFRFHAGILANYPALVSVSLPEGMTEMPSDLLSQAKTLQQVSLPSTLQKIGSHALYGCSSLQSIELPSSVCYIGAGAFEGCAALQEVMLPSAVTSLSAATFRNCKNLHTVGRLDEMEAVGGSAFYGCKSLKQVSLPRVKCIEDDTFYESGLEEIQLSESLTAIGRFAFYGCQNLTSFVVPSDVRSLGDAVFAECKYLQTVTLPEGLSYLPTMSFYQCSRLKHVNIPASVSTIRGMALSSTAIDSIELRDNVELWGRVFENCWRLSFVRLPSTLTQLPQLTFCDCVSLRHIDLPSGLTSLGDKCFRGCTALDSLCLGANVTALGEEIVGDCTSLHYICCDAEMPPSASNRTFVKMDTYKCEVCVPEPSLQDYQQAAGWKAFTHWNTPWSDEEPEPQYAELYHYYNKRDRDAPDFYIATHNIGAQTGDEVGTRFSSITSEEVEALVGAGWRLMTQLEAQLLAPEIFKLGLTRYFPTTYQSVHQGDADPGHVVVGEYWIEGGEVLRWRHTWGNRQTDNYDSFVGSPYYESSLPVRPVRDDLPLGFSMLHDLPQPVATYDMNGIRRNTAVGAMSIEIMNDGSVRKVIRR